MYLIYLQPNLSGSIFKYFRQKQHVAKHVVTDFTNNKSIINQDRPGSIVTILSFISFFISFAVVLVYLRTVVSAAGYAGRCNRTLETAAPRTSSLTVKALGTNIVTDGGFISHTPSAAGMVRLFFIRISTMLQIPSLRIDGIIRDVLKNNITGDKEPLHYLSKKINLMRIIPPGRTGLRPAPAV